MNDVALITLHGMGKVGWDYRRALDATRLRRFLLFGFGDAAVLEYRAHQLRHDTQYRQVQRINCASG